MEVPERGNATRVSREGKGDRWSTVVPESESAGKERRSPVVARTGYWGKSDRCATCDARVPEGAGGGSWLLLFVGVSCVLNLSVLSLFFC